MNKLLIILYLTILSGLKIFSQNYKNGYWLPLERVKQVAIKKEDICDSVSNFPFKKIKFLSDEKVSLFGFDAADPSVCTIIPTSKEHKWIVKDSIVNTLYPEFAIGSKIYIRVEKDSLFIKLTKNEKSFDQIFIKKHMGIEFVNYREVEVGNILLAGCYFLKDRLTKITFTPSGQIVVDTKTGSVNWKYASFVFKNYAPGNCNFSNSFPEGIVELSNLKGGKELFIVKKKRNQIDFFKVEEKNDFWEKSKVKFSFSIFYCNSNVSD